MGKKPVAVFITGLSGTGKTSLVRWFEQHPVEGWSVHDFDQGEYAIPSDEAEHYAWRIRQTASWLKVGIEEARQGLKTAVFGFSLWPQAMRELPEAETVDLHFAFIHCEPETRKQRLHERGSPHLWKGHKDWYDEFFATMEREAEMKVDTTSESVEQTAQKIKDWLQSL